MPGDLKEILKNYSRRLNSSQLLIDNIVQVINDVSGLSLNKNNLVISGRQLKIKTKTKERLNVLLLKEKILTRLKEEGIEIIDLR